VPDIFCRGKYAQASCRQPKNSGRQITQLAHIYAHRDFDLSTLPIRSILRRHQKDYPNILGGKGSLLNTFDGLFWASGQVIKGSDCE
jgi:hypothetical protein